MNPRFLRLILLIMLCLISSASGAGAAVYQWSVPIEQSRAFLWIPPRCQRVRAVLFGQNNMLEEPILENSKMRRTLADLGIAEVWVSPSMDHIFDFHGDANARFDGLMKSLADESGYDELARAPIIPLGHSAHATYPWNFAAGNPERTLAVLSVHGDAPETNLTGYGGKNVDWGDHSVDGVPGLMVMGEYEWIEERLQPLIDYQKSHPKTAITMLAEPGHGHFDSSDTLVDYLCLFIRKAVQYRLTNAEAPDGTTTLRPIDPEKGWLVDRWHLRQGRTTPPAPYAKYRGERDMAFWAFDREMAWATHNYEIDQTFKAPQLLGWVQEGQVLPQTNTHNQINLHLTPAADGITFKATGIFLSSVDAGSPNTTRWSALPPSSPIGHASGGGPVVLSRITGPVKQTAPDTFAIDLNRATILDDKRPPEIWLLATQPGDAHYKRAVQQAMLHLVLNKTGHDQSIDFPSIADQKIGTKTLKLYASSSAGLPVKYYVVSGPAEVDGDTLRFTLIPRRAKIPIVVTVVAWQWGRSGDAAVKTSTSVSRSFALIR